MPKSPEYDFPSDPITADIDDNTRIIAHQRGGNANTSGFGAGSSDYCSDDGTMSPTRPPMSASS